MVFSWALTALSCSEPASEPYPPSPQVSALNDLPAEDLVCREPAPAQEPWSVSYSRELSRSADQYEQILANDPRFANPADPQTRALRNRLLTHKIFSEALGDLNESLLGRR